MLQEEITKANLFRSSEEPWCLSPVPRLLLLLDEIAVSEQQHFMKLPFHFAGSNLHSLVERGS